MYRTLKGKCRQVFRKYEFDLGKKTRIDWDNLEFQTTWKGRALPGLMITARPRFCSDGE